MIEQEFGCGVDGEEEEQLLEIDGRAVAWDVFEHELEVALESLEICHLFSRKVRTKQMSAVSPALSVCVENAIAQKRRKGSRAITQAVVFELQTEDRLHIFGLAGRNDWHSDHSGMESSAESLKTFLVLLQDDMTLGVLVHCFEYIQAKNWVLVEPCFAGFTTILVDDALSREVQCNPGVEEVGKESARSDEDDWRVRHCLVMNSRGRQSRIN